jgi:hypothetical protein
MTTATTDADSDWLTELDVIDTSWNVTTFRYSHLGKLPLELLEIVVRFVPTASLSAVARINPQLRELAEKNLYSHITIGDRYESTMTNDEFWPLCRTLKRRSDLAQMVRVFDGTVYDQNVKVEVDLCTIFPDDAHFRTSTTVMMNQTVLAGRIFTELLPRADKIQLTLNRACSPYNGWADMSTCKLLALKPLNASRLIPDFNSSTAHQIQFLGLQQLTELIFAGSEFHWTLAKLPCLRRLCLVRPCVILPDEAPHEMNGRLRTLEISARSAILRSSSRHYDNLKDFLAHFPSLVNLRININDFDVDELPKDESDTQELGDCDYNVLLKRLVPIADHLQALHLGIHVDSDHFTSTQGRAYMYLYLAQPASTFQQFKSLKNLIVPYRCLFGQTTSAVDTLPSPTAILPHTLEDLRIHCPHVHIYDWLLRIRTARDQLPVLSQIELYCQLPFGDEYPLFAFENSDHPAMDVLEGELGITMHITSREGDWTPEWNAYDLDTLDIIDWLDSLTEHGGMDRLLEWIKFET